MDEKKTTDVLDKYVKLKDEYDALKMELGALKNTNTELATAYEAAKGEIGNLQKIITKHVVSAEPDKTVESKPKTLRDIFLNEYSKIEQEK